MKMAFIDLTYTEIVGNDLKMLDKDFKVESGWEKIWKGKIQLIRY